MRVESWRPSTTQVPVERARRRRERSSVHRVLRAAVSAHPPRQPPSAALRLLLSSRLLSSCSPWAQLAGLLTPRGRGRPVGLWIRPRRRPRASVNADNGDFTCDERGPAGAFTAPGGRLGLQAQGFASLFGTFLNCHAHLVSLYFAHARKPVRAVDVPTGGIRRSLQ